MTAVSMTVNGKIVKADVDPRTLLVQFLRENLRLTGTHVGCDTSQCGACVVHVDGKPVKSCTVFAQDVAGSTVKTIEGMANALLARAFPDTATLEALTHGDALQGVLRQVPETPHG